MQTADDRDASDDEEAPLLSRARDEVTRLQGRSLWFSNAPWIISLCCLQVMLTRAESVIVFPYLRSLQYCDGQTNTTDIAVHVWSGSDFCQSRSHVTRLAQAEAGYVNSFGMVVHTIALPLLGWLGDHYGRKPLVLLAFAGLFIESVLNAMVQRVDVLAISVAVQMATSAFTPALLAMIADSTQSEGRVGAYAVCLVAAVPTYAIVYVSMTHFIVAEHLHSYQRTWAALAILSALSLIVAVCCPETLPLSGDEKNGAAANDEDEEVEEAARTGNAVARGAVEAALSQHSSMELGADDSTPASRHDDDATSAPETSSKAARLCTCAHALSCCCAASRHSKRPRRGVAESLASHDHDLGSLFAPCAVPSLRYIMVVEALAIFGVAAFSTLDGFAMVAYSWEQETMYYVKLATLPAAGFALAASAWLPRVIGSLRTFQLSILLLLISLSLMCLAQWHERLLAASLMLAGGAAVAVLPVLRLLSTQASPTQQAGTAAAVLAVAHGARAIGLATHAYLFEHAAAYGLLYAPFAVGTVSASVALFVALVLAPPERAWTVLRTAGDHVESQHDVHEDASHHRNV